ncbi:isocitrate lyase/PEP mutase family protein [Microbacterium gorillae]|uniref:isocitrate lyase/PEP mutase family protein n=1 Tax=Microbacterium gorillae TaxID=1231063 RepID=UPI000694BDB3|nr:isocitrate lyase/phosphoenolpyruvate mutase family protein [Microbacterium gorillae]
MSTFRDLHRTGTFVLPNPRDAGEARLFEALGFAAVATTSAGFAATLGRRDQSVTRDELVQHVTDLVAAVHVPVAVDAENGYADDPAGVAATVRALAEVGAAGVSIEDYDPKARGLYDALLARDRVSAAAEAAQASGIVVTARSEGLLYGLAGVDETLGRLQAFAEAGADCLYAPGPRDLPTIERLVAYAGGPVNVLAFPGGPSVDELRDVGVRRVSVGSWFSTAATAVVADLARTLLRGGGVPDDLPRPPADLIERAWGRG